MIFLFYQFPAIKCTLGEEKELGPIPPFYERPVSSTYFHQVEEI